MQDQMHPLLKVLIFYIYIYIYIYSCKHSQLCVNDRKHTSDESKSFCVLLD